VSDGEKFGVQRLPLSVVAYDPGKLGISDVVLSRRVHVHKISTDATEAGEQVSGSYTPLVSKAVEITPTADANSDRRIRCTFILRLTIR
jgi:hypothetical protein